MGPALAGSAHTICPFAASVHIDAMRGKPRFSAGVAQLVEQRIRNAKVEGSTPSTGTIELADRSTIVHDLHPAMASPRLIRDHA